MKGTFSFALPLPGVGLQKCQESYVTKSIGSDYVRSGVYNAGRFSDVLHS